MKQKDEPYRYALSQLAHACDGAISKDGAGFNRNDAQVGRRLASLPESSWHKDDFLWAYYACRRYAKQLGRYGISLKDLPRPRQESTNERVDLLASDKW